LLWADRTRVPRVPKASDKRSDNDLGYWQTEPDPPKRRYVPDMR
jgi:hypothetical protein